MSLGWWIQLYPQTTKHRLPKTSCEGIWATQTPIREDPSLYIFYTYSSILAFCFRMNIHVPAILVFTRVPDFWPNHHPASPSFSRLCRGQHQAEVSLSRKPRPSAPSGRRDKDEELVHGPKSCATGKELRIASRSSKIPMVCSCPKMFRGQHLWKHLWTVSGIRAVLPWGQ